MQTFINLLRGRTWNIELDLITVGWILAVGLDARYIDYYDLLVKRSKTLVITIHAETICLRCSKDTHYNWLYMT